MKPKNMIQISITAIELLLGIRFYVYQILD